MRIKKGDQVEIIAGKSKGKKGQVLKVFPSLEKILVEKANLIKKHVKPRREGEKGQIMEMPAPLDVSNVMLVCPHCKKKTRIGYVIGDKSKKRICKKCQKEIN